MFIQGILDLFGSAMEVSYGFLTQDLSSFSPGAASVMEAVNGGLQAFSYALLAVLTLWNVVHTATSYAELKKPEMLLKFFLRFALTKYAVGMAWPIVTGIVTVCGALTGSVFVSAGLTDGNAWAGITAPDFGGNSIMDIIASTVGALLNPLAKVPELLLGLLGFIVALVLSVTLMLTVIGRFFKIYLFAALSPIPLSCFGAEDTWHIGRGFLHSFAAVSLEGLVIGLAMIVFAAYSQNPLITFESWGIFNWLGAAAEEITYMFTLIFNMLLLLGLIKGADQAVQQIFSHH